MRKRSGYRPRPACVPMLVALHTTPDLELTERLSVEALRGGWATTDHFDNLADCRDLMSMAATERNDRSTLAVCELGYHALISIKERHARTGRIGASGDELQALLVLVDTSEDFWKRQSGDLFSRHYKAMRESRKAQHLERSA